MGKKKKAETQQLPYSQTNTYTEWKPSDTPDVQAARAAAPMPETLAPNLQAQYDRARQQSANRWNTAYAANIPEVTRRAMQAQEERGAAQDYGSMLSQSAWDANNANFARRMALAEMTLGRPLQTSSSGYNTQFSPQQQGGGFWSNLVGGALGAATKFI